MNDAINLINGAINVINNLPGVNVNSIKKLSLPRLARGGIVDRATLAEIGENGREAIIPLENNKGWIKELASELSAIMIKPLNNATEAARAEAYNYNYMVDAFKDALTGVKVMLDDETMGHFVTATIADAIYV